MAWEWLAPAGTAFGAVVGALAVVVSGQLASRSGVRAQEIQLATLKHQTAAEDRRALVAAKQVLYSKFLVELEIAFVAALDVSLLADTPEGQQAAKVSMWESAQRLLALQAEIAVLAGPSVYTLTGKLFKALDGLAEGSTSKAFSEAKADVVYAFHKDVAS
ncbi:hypothetical protein O7631_01790 [Micromonospora sp. WMMD967]|uniref:hypothetical protein n=1 Tax=Micromonospora sp. WMMD967 TaxID=3016101 RepID=UPI002415FBCC|nr:hypothetical protein [Micromonospora sp. WMMD967]MDG4835247.1 hypothetical protein [Micromonospora sp. WMMD967]